MSEEIDLFQQLNELCSNRTIIKNFEADVSAAAIKDEKWNPDIDICDMLGQYDGKRKTRKPSKQKTATRHTPSDDISSAKIAYNLRSTTTPPVSPEKESTATATSMQQKGRRRQRRNATGSDQTAQSTQLNQNQSEQVATRRRSMRHVQAPTAQPATTETAPPDIDLTTTDDSPLLDGSNNSSAVTQRRNGPSVVMRSRRNYIAEKAARATNIDYVDLVTAPMPRIDGVINVDSDSEEEKGRSKTKSNTPLDASFDEENPEISVKITWHGVPEVFKLRKYQKFSTIFNILAEREKTTIENLVFNVDSRIIEASDTPVSIDYKIYQFIAGRIVAEGFGATAAQCGKKRDANTIEVKVQSDKFKRPLKVEILKTDKFKILYIKCAEELNVTIDQLKLSFDGDLLDYDSMPSDLELLGGEVIDLRVKE